MRKITYLSTSLFLLLGLMACEENLPGPQTLDELTFTFEEPGDAPLFISVNSQEDGSLIEYFKLDSQTVYTIQIPESKRAESYNINYYLDARYTYLNKLVKVYSFSDIRTKTISHLPQEEFNHDYKALHITSSEPIETFFNGGGGNYYNKISDDGLSANLELGVSSKSGRGRVIVAKLVGETAYRTYTFEDPLQFTPDTLDISAFSLVDDLQSVELDDAIKSGRLTIFTKFKSQTLLGRIYDSYSQGLSTGFPLVTGDFDYYSMVSYQGIDNSKGLSMSKGIPSLIKPIDLNMEVSNTKLSTFSQELQATDIAINTFHDDDFIWHHFDGTYDGFKVIRAKVPQEILDEFPSLTRDADIFATTLLRMGAGAEISYEDLVLPGNKNYWSHYEVIIKTPLYNPDKEIVLIETKTIRQ